MTRDDDFPDIPGYVPIKEAAKLLGISDPRMYGYVRDKRIPALKAGRTLMIPTEEIERFKLNPPGRTRTGRPSWRVHNPRSTMVATDMYVQVREGQQAKLLEKLQQIQRADRHLFPGTIARYVVKGNPNLTELHFFLVWKDVEMPVEVTHQQDFLALQEELADVLDWETAQYSTNETIIHT